MEIRNVHMEWRVIDLKAKILYVILHSTFAWGWTRSLNWGYLFHL